MAKNLFVFGLNDFNRRMLERIRGAEGYRFHKLLDRAELTERADYDIEAILAHARERLDGFDGPVDGIVHYIDFPVSTIVPILAREYGLPSASLEAVLKCEDKYWSRVEQSKVVPEAVPPFAAFDPASADAVDRVEREIGYPCWVKPVKSFSSYLGFRVEERADLEAAVVRLREEIGRFAAPFDSILERVERPAELADTGGGTCLAEGIIDGHQCTLEGYGHGGRITVYGAIDSKRHANRSSFGRYQYPSSLPAAVRDRMEAIVRRFMEHIGYDNAPFNAELFWDEANDRIWLLEINTRISESHCNLFEQVDGVSNHEVAVDLALGREPDFRHGRGDHEVAGKFFYRVYGDARVSRVPTDEEVRELEALTPGTHIEILAEEGHWLSELWDQDSYTYCLALIWIGGDNEADLLAKHRRVEQSLRFDFESQKESA